MQDISDINEELFNDWLICAEQFGVLLVDRLDAGGIGHPLGHPRDNERHRVPGHKSGEDEIQHEGNDQRGREPNKPSNKISPIPFQTSTPYRSSNDLVGETNEITR